MLTLYQPPVNSAVPSISRNPNLFNFSWEDVIIQLEIARASCPTAGWKSARKADRFLAKTAYYGEKWIDLIPDEYGLSVIRGGLALVFSVSSLTITRIVAN